LQTAYSIVDFGATGDGRTSDTAAIQRAIDICAAKGGGVVQLPAGGTYLSGQITLADHVNLHIEGDATLLASLRADDFRDGMLIHATGATNIAITGTGTIEGRGVEFMEGDDRYIYRVRRGVTFRPRLIHLTACTNVTLRDFTIHDSPSWAIHPIGCVDLLIHGVRILNDLKIPNCDGIDPDDCRNVRISDCYIRSGDDCIVIKSTEPHQTLGPCENITVTGCTLTSTSTALKIGTETWQPIRNIIFSGCIIKDSNRGLSIQLRDQGDIENIVFSDMIVGTRLFYESWWGKSEPIHISAVHRTPGTRLGRLRHIRFSNVLSTGEAGVYITGDPGARITDIVLDSVRVEIDKTSKWPGGLHDRRPLEDAEHLYPHRTAGVYIDHARDVTLRDVDVVWGDNRPGYYGPALECHSAPGLRLQGFTGESAHPAATPAQIID